MKKIIKVFVCTMIFTVSLVNFVFADWIKENGKYKYFNTTTNQYIVNNWIQTGNGYYFFDQNGYAVTGWYLINDLYYYFNNDGLMMTGFQEVNGKTYYLDATSGKMVTGWVQIYDNGKLLYMYFGDDGAAYDGWKQIGSASKWYYFNEKKALVDTWAKINEVWYHFNKDASMDTGWVVDGGKMYYLNISNGGLTKGWVQDQNGNEYYLSDNDGSLIISATIVINGISYTFDETGKCVSKNQYTGNANAGAAGTSGTGAYGISVGTAPGTGLVQGISSSSAQISIEKSLIPGSTTGPK